MPRKVFRITFFVFWNTFEFVLDYFWITFGLLLDYFSHQANMGLMCFPLDLAPFSPDPPPIWLSGASHLQKDAPESVLDYFFCILDYFWICFAFVSRNINYSKKPLQPGHHFAQKCSPSLLILTSKIKNIGFCSRCVLKTTIN